MKRATENQRSINIRTLSEYFPQRNKVKDIIFQQRFRPHFTPETPMKPSQLPNQLSYPPPRRMLPLQSPEQCHRGRLGPLRHPPHPPGPIHSSRFAPINPTNIGPPVNRFSLRPRGRLGPLQHQHHERPGSFHCSPAIRPQPWPHSVFNPASPQFMKDLSNHSSPSHIVTPSLLTRGVQDVLLPLKGESPGYSQRPLCDSQPSPNNQPFDRSNSSNLPMMDSPVAPCQEQHKQMPSSENSIPVVELNCSSQKRHREFEDCDNSFKKLRLASINSDKAQTPKPAVGNSHSISLMSQPSARHSSVLELSPKTTDSHLGTEPACGQSTHLELSSTFKPTQSSCASLSLKPCIKKRSSLGAKQAYISSTQNHPLKLLQLRSPSVSPDEESLTKISEESDNRDKSSSEVTQKDTGSAPHDQFDSHHSGHTHRSTSPVKMQRRSDSVEKRRKSDSGTHKPVSKTNSHSLNCCTIKRNKSRRSRRSVAVPNDINELFTPDPLVYVVSHKSVKPIMNGIKCPTSEKSCSSSTGTTSSTPVTGSSCRKTGSHAVDTKVSSLSSAHHLHMSLPTVALQRVKLDNSTIAKDNELKNSPVPSSGKHLNDESVKSDEKCTFFLPNNMKHCAVETETTTSHCSQSSLLERNIDVELDLGLSMSLDLDVTQSSLSSEEDEQLVSLQEMMEHVTKPAKTPEKEAFSEPSTRRRHSSQPKSQQLPSTTKPGIYKNNLDQMLKEINNNKKAKAIETQLLTACKEDLLRIAEFEEDEMKREEDVSAEQQEFLQRYSLMSNAIKEVPPGETVFNLEKFGRIFNQDTLQLRRCMVNPQGIAEQAILWSSPAQLRLHVNIGLFQEVYDCCSPCPTQVTRFLFRMMSVHSERMLSEKILQTLCDIACTTAYQIVKNGSQQLKVWVPSLADVALVLMNMGVAFVTLFPFENLQPPFTERDLLEDICIKRESPSSNVVENTFPVHNWNNILKYLSYCMSLCPRAYSDDELLLLLTVVGKVGLDTQLILQSSLELYPLQYTLINNIRDWNTMLPRICQAFSDLTDDHHNMCQLVQVLPDNTHGKQLRRHLSMSMISKLLDGNCTYRPTENEFQLSELRPYLPRMQPSSIFREMLSRKDKEVDRDTLDQQSYYLCYSLLTLANEASNFQFFPAHQKRQLLFLCSELETHVKCDIRESEKCLYRSKVKDLVARIYTKWQMLLQRTRPLHGKLYDYWQPLPADTLTCGQEVKDNMPETMEDEEEDSDEDVLTVLEDEMKERDNTMEDTNKMEEDMKPEEMEINSAMDDTGN